MKFVIEHLEDELHEWCVLEYQHMAETVGKGNFIITNIDINNDKIPSSLLDGHVIFTPLKAKDYLKGKRVALLDQCANKILQPEDRDEFDYILCGGILGTDEFDGPMIDRTEAIREHEFSSRHLGDKQMTADTAVIVSYRVLTDDGGQGIDKMNFIDKPSIQIAKKEFVEMPFRYLRKSDGNPLLPRGMLEYLRENNEM